MTIMKRKDYMKPTFTIVELQHKMMLLQTSGTKGMRTTYGSANSDVDSNELGEDGSWEWN